MGTWQPKHQFTKSVRDFLVKTPGVLFGAPGEPTPVPRVSFAVRLGAAGPLRCRDQEDELSAAVTAILVALKQYADTTNPKFHQRMFSNGSAPPPQLRLIGQLASGFDQLAASAALATGYCLHVVLPGSRAAFVQDIKRNLQTNLHGGRSPADGPGEPAAVGTVGSGLPAGQNGMHERDAATDAVALFDRLIEKAERVLELDRDDESSDAAPFSFRDYSQAGLVILDHSELVLVAVHDEQSPALGGSRWIAAQAEARDLTVIEMPIERPFAARLIWTVDGRREQRMLFQEGSRQTSADAFAAALDYRLLGPAFDLSKVQLGVPERRFVAQLSPEHNERAWSRRWQLDSPNAALARHYLGLAEQHIETDLKGAKVWADLRASAMAELVRGSFIFSALLAVVAVFGALLGIFFPILLLGLLGKLLEVFCLVIIFWLMLRSRRRGWRSHWLSLRRLERYIEQTAWLLLLGRCRVYEPPSELGRFQIDDVAKWTNAYFRALIRNCSFPTARFTPDYLGTVHALALRNLIIDQIHFLQDEAKFQQKSDRVLERCTWALVFAAGIVTLAFFPYLWISGIQHAGDSGRIVGAFGALCTATAAALSAIRSHGEYAQIAARYEGTSEALQAVQTRLAARLPDCRPDYSPPRPRSAWLVSTIGEATDILIREVQGWRAILQMKEIEPT